MPMSKMSIVVAPLLLLSTGCRTDSPSPFGASEAGVSTPRQLLRSYQFPVGHPVGVPHDASSVASGTTGRATRPAGYAASST